MSTVNVSRRRFLRHSVFAGISVYLAPLHSKAFAALFENQLLTLPAWDPAAKHLRFRIDGKAKAMGKKVFARDIRAADMPHWPATQSLPFILRVTQADKRFDGLDLSLLEEGLQPDRLVNAEDLARDGLAFSPFYGDDMLLAQGKTPAYLGQTVAILIYYYFARYSVRKIGLNFKIRSFVTERKPGLSSVTLGALFATYELAVKPRKMTIFYQA